MNPSSDLQQTSTKSLLFQFCSTVCFLLRDISASIKNMSWKQSETAVSAGLVKIGENLKETKKNKTLNEFAAYMQKTCDVAEKVILAKKNLRKKCVNRDKM